MKDVFKHLNFEDLNIGMSGHVSSNASLKNHLNLLKEAIRSESFETAAMYAENLSKSLFTRHEYESMKRGAK